MGFQVVRRKIFSVQAIVSFMESNTMVMDDTTNVNLMVSSYIAFCCVKLVHECLSHAHIIHDA